MLERSKGRHNEGIMRSLQEMIKRPLKGIITMRGIWWFTMHVHGMWHKARSPSKTLPGIICSSVPMVTGHFVPRSFRTQVISYRFGHFVPTFIFNLVISYPVWSFRTHFVPSLVITYLLLQFSRKPFWSFRTYFLLFRTQVISYPKSFRTHFCHFVPRSFRTHFQTRYELIGYEMTFFAVICYFQTSRYELTLVWNDFFFLQLCKVEICMVS